MKRLDICIKLFRIIFLGIWMVLSLKMKKKKILEPPGASLKVGHRGFQGDLYSKLWGGQTIRDTINLMESNSLPYECIFHLVCIMLSANSQFSHTKTSVLFGGYALVVRLDHAPCRLKVTRDLLFSSKVACFRRFLLNKANSL